jgi:hypothetical protein
MNYSFDKLFDKITEIIASPHTTITEHDSEKTVKILSEIASHIKRVTEEEDCRYRKYFASHVENYLRENYEKIYTANQNDL